MLVVDVGSWDEIPLAMSAIESIVDTGRRPANDGSIEIVTPYPGAFATLTQTYPFVSVRKPDAGNGPVAARRTFSIRTELRTVTQRGPALTGSEPGPSAPRQAQHPPRDRRPEPTAAGAPRRPRRTRRHVLVGTAAVLAAIVGGSFWSAQRGRSPAAVRVAPPSIPVETRPPTILDIAMRPLIEDAWERRERRRASEPDLAHRIDEALNWQRYNVLIFGWGEEHGETYGDYGGSISVLSFDITSGTVDSISLSRDIRTPEIERLLGDDGARARVLRHVYRSGKDTEIGGFLLMREVVENMTGLAIDHQFLVKDVFLLDLIALLIRQAGRPLRVTVEKAHRFASFRLAGRDFPAGARLAAGTHTMDATQAMQYVLAEDQSPSGKLDERSYRKGALFRAMLDHLQTILQDDLRRLVNPLSSTFLDQLLGFLIQQRQAGAVVVEHPEVQLLIADMFRRRFWLERYNRQLWNGEVHLPRTGEAGVPRSQVRRQLVIHDPFFGDGGVRRVHAIRDTPLPSDNSRIRDEVTRGFLNTPDLSWMLIPAGGDPYASDLVQEYWGAVRGLVRQTLTTG